MPSKLSVKYFQMRWVAICLGLIGVLSDAVAQSPRIVRLKDGPAHREDRILIVPKQGRSAMVNTLHARHKARLKKSFPGMGNIQVIELPPGVSAAEMVARYRQSGEVESADLDVVLTACAQPNDPRVANGDQWHLNNFGQSGGVFDADMDAVEAWSNLNSASNVIVAVVDSGLRVTHQDIAANLWVNPGEIRGNGIDDDGNGAIDDVHGLNSTGPTPSGNLTDYFGHGTHVAGILGAVGNNALGVSGVAWSTRLMTCRFLDNFGNGYASDLIECLNYARTNGAKVVNCSFETPGPINTALSNAFWNLREAGVVVVAAAGNTGLDTDLAPRYPACFAIDNIISVMASSRSDTYLGYNYGATTIDLAAPGFDILSTYYRSDSDYYLMSGTSMATPCVAGAAALILAKFPHLTAQQVVNRVLGTVDKVPDFSGKCVTGGRLNLARALSGGFTIFPGTYAWIPTNGMTSLTLTDNGVSGARPLGFSFGYTGKEYTNLYVGANGLVGFLNLSLSASSNTNLPLSTIPNAILCPFWDDLNPAGGGQVWFGTMGTAPNRYAVVSWVEVPHKLSASTKFTFQIILYENENVRFQYAKVNSGNSQYAQGVSATIGLEDFMGGVGTKYSFMGSPSVVTNGQAILFIPNGNPGVEPSIEYVSPVGSGGSHLRVNGVPGERCVVQVSPDLVTWSDVATNLIPDDGVLPISDLATAGPPNRFYRAVIRP
ncbi:MAG: S8 family serine peptidase [Verrucomicrobia bacterium]|nr:S8 family serine peptidase [Verrucomicrobiota bacterium]